MKKSKKIAASCKCGYSKIHLIDKCLMVFMVILLLQSIYTLLVNSSTPKDSASVDIIVRTTISSIFGYFISANFIKNEEHNIEYYNTVKNDTVINSQYESEKKMFSNTIGFSAEDINKLPPESTSLKTKDNNTYILSNNIQTLIVTSIGVTALIVLIIVRNFIEIAPSSLSNVGQFRDIVCGCIGFLLGCPTE